MRAKLPWVLLLAGLIIVSVAYQYFTEEYESHIWAGESKEARTNPYLAAQRFLEGRNIVVEPAIDKLDFTLIPTGDLVLLSQVDAMLVSQSQIDEALDWVSRGGYLLVGVSEESEGGSSILNEFDISPVSQDIEIAEAFVDDDGNSLTPSQRMREANKRIDERRAEKKKREDEKAKGELISNDINDEESNGNSASGDSSASEDDSASEEDDEKFNEQLFDLLNSDFNHEFYKTHAGDNDDEIYLAVLDSITLSHPQALGDYDDDYSSDTYELLAWSDDEHGERLLQFSYGDGTFTAISSTELWENKYIGLGDHAYFLSYLIPDSSTLHLFYNITAPSISNVTNRYFHEVIWSALVLLCLWLWFCGIRVQRVADVVDGQRRNFAEHLSSSAKFLVANKQFRALLDPIQEDIEQQMRPFYPRFSQLNEHSQVAMLAERTQISEPTLKQWVRYCNSVDTQQELLTALKIGNAIRKKL